MSEWKTSIKSSNFNYKSSIKKRERPAEKLSNTLGDIKGSTFKTGFSKKDRENHTHILGGTGTGKSKIIELLIREDIQSSKAGMILIDPHGSLYDEVVLYASHRYPRLAERFILFNPANDLDYVVGFNPVVSDNETQIDYMLDTLISACLKAWGQDDTSKTPRITKWLENIFYTLIVNDLTLLESAPLLSTSKKNDHRQVLFEKVVSDVIREDWIMFENSPQTQKQNLIEGAANRLRKFLRSDIIRSIIGQKQHALDISKAMDEGKIVLVNLNGKAKISRENTQLLGTMLVNEIYRCSLLRDHRDKNLKPFYVYIDEFARFVTRDIAYSLEETRKYKVFFTLAHQHLAQLKKEDEYLYASVMTNCKNKIVFGSLSIEDAEIMAHELNTGFLDLKTIKDEQYRIRVRHIEERRTVVTKNYSSTEGDNWQESQGYSDSNSENHSTGNSNSDSHGRSQKDNYYYDRDSNNSPIRSEGSQRGSSSNHGTSYSNTNSNTQSTGGSHSTTHGESTAEVPFLKPEEVKELSSRTFWSMNELMYMKVGDMKNQGTAQAFIKVGVNEPIQCEIKQVHDVHYYKATSPRKIEEFHKKSIAGNSDCCISINTAKHTYQERQKSIFGEALLFDDMPINQQKLPISIDGEFKIVEKNTGESPFNE